MDTRPRILAVLAACLAGLCVLRGVTVDRRTARRGDVRRTRWRAKRRSASRSPTPDAPLSSKKSARSSAPTKRSSRSTRRAATATTRCGRPATWRSTPSGVSARRRTRTPACGCCSGWSTAYPDQQAREAGPGGTARRPPSPRPPTPRPRQRQRPEPRAVPTDDAALPHAPPPPRPRVELDRHDSRHPPQRCCPMPFASPSSSTAKSRSTTSAFPIRRASSSISPARGRRRARRSDAALRERRRHRPAGAPRPASEQHDARRARRRRRHQLQRLPALQPVSSGDRLRAQAQAVRRPTASPRAWPRRRVRDLAAVARRPSRRSTVSIIAAARSSAVDGRRAAIARRRHRAAPTRDRLPATTHGARPQSERRPRRLPPVDAAGQERRRRTSMARQLGLGVSRIVIDPGHGGHDPGAKGKGVTEAELVLDVALRLEKLLQKVPGVEVILTRRTDDFIPLPERTAIANREGADLFLSIHANASTQRAGARHRNLLPELREQPERGGGRGARERRRRRRRWARCRTSSRRSR